MLRILVTRVVCELELELLDCWLLVCWEMEACCCLRAFCTEVVMLGVRVVMICWTMVATWLWDIDWLELCWLELREEELELEIRLETVDSIWLVRAVRTCWTICCFLICSAAAA